MEKSVFLIENCDARQCVTKDLECSHNNCMMTLFQFIFTVILEYSPDSWLGLEHAFYLSDHLKNIDDLIASIIQSFASQQEFNNILLCYILVVSEQNMVADVRLDHVHSEDFDGCFRSIIQVLLHFLRAIVGRFVSHGWLAVVNFHISEDVELIWI